MTAFHQSHVASSDAKLRFTNQTEPRSHMAALKLSAVNKTTTAPLICGNTMRSVADNVSDDRRSRDVSTGQELMDDRGVNRPTHTRGQSWTIDIEFLDSSYTFLDTDKHISDILNTCGSLKSCKEHNRR